MRRIRALAVVVVVSCARQPVVWDDPLTTAAFPDEAIVPTPAVENACPGSIRVALTPTRAYAVWWRVRPDSSAALVATTSSDRWRTWRPPVNVDTTDAGSGGCTRPPPSIAAVADDVYIAYSMTAAEGTGVFFAHSMDAGSTYHAPVAVIYGDRVVRAAIAADARRVAIAYEEPSGTAPRVGLALSSTQGHIFETHVPASRDVDVADEPTVTLRGDRVTVSWRAQGGRTIRVGHIQ
jgi:hypothetical protein